MRRFIAFAGFIATMGESLTYLARASSATAPRLPDAGHRLMLPAVVRPEISRFPSKKHTDMPGSQTTQGRQGACDIAPHRVAFRYANNVGAPDYKAFAAQWLTYPHICQRFAPYLTVHHA